jgi:hypothetical protein
MSTAAKEKLTVKRIRPRHGIGLPVRKIYEKGDNPPFAQGRLEGPKTLSKPLRKGWRATTSGCRTIVLGDIFL